MVKVTSLCNLVVVVGRHHSLGVVGHRVVGHRVGRSRRDGRSRSLGVGGLGVGHLGSLGSPVVVERWLMPRALSTLQTPSYSQPSPPESPTRASQHQSDSHPRQEHEPESERHRSDEDDRSGSVTSMAQFERHIQEQPQSSSSQSLAGSLVAPQ